MILKVTKITVLNSQILVDDLQSLAALKVDLSQQLGVIPSDIHFDYTETNDE